MQEQKLDNLLNLAMDATLQEREKSGSLNVGYQEELRLWDVIVKYNQEIGELEEEGISVVPLLGGYAVVTIPEKNLDAFSRKKQVEFVEKPKRLYFAVSEGKTASCISSLQMEREGLSGQGILIGMADSGVDYFHPDFRKEDGTTRILRLWDQTIPGNPPQGYKIGTEYTEEEINQALSLSETEGRRLVPSTDTSGHGTAVLGIAAGNGRASRGRNRGIAYESGIVVVKLGIPRKDSFPRTTELIQAVDYLVRQSQSMGIPMAINLSFGNNYGSHRGDSLLETYLDGVANMGRLCICTGTGNNGNLPLHTGGRLLQSEIQEIELGVGPYEPTLNVQLWKHYEDQMEIYLESPSGMRLGPFSEILGPQRYRAGNTELLIYYGKPGPYFVTQEIYIDFIPRETYVDSGVWKIILQGKNIKDGEYFLWLPGGKVLNPLTAFYFPRATGTLTIPSTASRLIAVGAYDSRRDAYADFSGRGSSFLPYGKPDLAAPGVNIITSKAGGGYEAVTGTSFATPFVSGACALLMEWGMVKGNDPFLYGEKVKAYLRRGARRIPGYERYPNEEVGWGALCVKESLPGHI